MSKTYRKATEVLVWLEVAIEQNLTKEVPCPPRIRGYHSSTEWFQALDKWTETEDLLDPFQAWSQHQETPPETSSKRSKVMSTGGEHGFYKSFV